MKLNYITIMVRDMESSLAFYTKLVGLQVVRQFGIDYGKIAFLTNGKEETKLELIQLKDAQKVSTIGMVMNYQINEPLEVVHARAIQLGYKPTDIIHHATKPTYFQVQDPDGITVEFSL